MRIIGGEFKGRRFSPPSGLKARPTTDYAKESLFNILNNRLDFGQTKVLDLFAGTGSISLEFVSRGCNQVTCVEMLGLHYTFINKCIGELGLKSYITPIKGDVFRFISKCTDSFDLIFSDAPYDLKNGDTLPDLIFTTSVLKSDGIYIMEHSDKKDFSRHPNFREVRKYGKVNFSFFGHQINEAD
ncbi:MAG: RsmD family RNA methyltransferase [Breznakibacter sp.]